MEPNRPGENKDSEEQITPRSDPDSIPDPLSALNESIDETEPLASSGDSDTLKKRQRTESPRPAGPPSPHPFMVAGEIFK